MIGLIFLKQQALFFWDKLYFQIYNFSSKIIIAAKANWIREVFSG